MKNKLKNIPDNIVSFYIYWIIFILVFYMAFSLIDWFVWLFNKFNLIVNDPKELIEDKLLHTIAFSIILVKAYIILMSYATYKHVSIKYIVEISIIAPAVEIIFNNSNYELINLIMLWTFWVINLLVYMIFYKSFEKMSHIEK